MVDVLVTELTADTISAANSLTLKPGQAAFLQPETYASLEQTLDPSGSWPRVAVADGSVLGYIMGSFDDDPAEDFLRAAIWRINVAAEAQGEGVGRVLVDAFADEARSRGVDRITVVWAPGDDGPGAFFAAVGFEIVGETRFGEHIGARTL